ncbi:MAG: MBL fold metallo-hydrolase [Brevinematia bacterium]
MKVIFLGTGTSTGVPLIGCNCRVCRSDNPRNKRLRSSMYFEYGGVKVLVDVTPDFRQQALNNDITYLDAVLITHAHADHINGLDDIRQINLAMGWKIIPLFANDSAYYEIKNRFDYVFKNPVQLGGGKPMVELKMINDFDEISISGIKIFSFPYYHGKIKVSGYKVGNLSYITDVSFIPKKTLDFLKGTKVLIISALRFLPHTTHFTLSEVKNLVNYLKPDLTYITHMGHEIDYDEVSDLLKGSNIFLGYDGMVLEL